MSEKVLALVHNFISLESQQLKCLASCRYLHTSFKIQFSLNVCIKGGAITIFEMERHHIDLYRKWNETLSTYVQSMFFYLPKLPQTLANLILQIIGNMIVFSKLLQSHENFSKNHLKICAILLVC